MKQNVSRNVAFACGLDSSLSSGFEDFCIVSDSSEIWIIETHFVP